MYPMCSEWRSFFETAIATIRSNVGTKSTLWEKAVAKSKCKSAYSALVFPQLGQYSPVVRCKKHGGQKLPSPGGY